MAKKIRYTIDLTDELNEEIEEIAERAGISKSEVFRRALSLFKVTERAAQKGEHVGIARNVDDLKTEFILT